MDLKNARRTSISGPTPMTPSAKRVARQYLEASGLDPAVSELVPPVPSGVTLLTKPGRGWASVEASVESSTGEVAAGLNRHMVSRLTGAPATVPWLSGSAKAFSFHWSNGSAKWDVIAARKGDFPFIQDGADFILFVGPLGLSPLGSLWTLTEMKYVAKALKHHPGYTGSVEGGRTFFAGL